MNTREKPTAARPQRPTWASRRQSGESKLPHCPRCDDLGRLIVSVQKTVKGRVLKYTAAARCNCQHGLKYPGLVLYDELPGTSPADDHLSLYRTELVMWHGEAAGRAFDALCAAAKAMARAGKPLGFSFDEAVGAWNKALAEAEGQPPEPEAPEEPEPPSEPMAPPDDPDLDELPF